MKFTYSKPSLVWWRLALYELLTQGILMLAWLRERLIRWEWTSTPQGRVFDIYDGGMISCCDCGLEHRMMYFAPGESCNHQPDYGERKIIGHCYPMRPTGYQYRLRAGAGTPTLAKEKPPG